MNLFPRDSPSAMWAATHLQPPASDPELTIPAASPWGQQILEIPKMCLIRAVELRSWCSDPIRSKSRGIIVRFLSLLPSLNPFLCTDRPLFFVFCFFFFCPLKLKCLFYKLVFGNTTSSRSIGNTFPTAFAHFYISVSHFGNSHKISHIFIIVLFVTWSVISDLWRYYYKKILTL